MKNAYKNNDFTTEHLNEGLRKRALSGVGFTAFAQGGSFILMLASTIILARLLRPEDFGLVAMVTTFSLLLQNFGFNGFTEAVIQEENLKDSTVNSVFWVNICISSSLTFLFMVLSPVLAWFYNEPKLKIITIAIALSIISSGLGTIHSAILKRNMQFFTVSLISLSSKLISVILTIILALLGWGYWALVINVISLPLIDTIGAWLFCQWRPGKPNNLSRSKKLVLFALNVYGKFIFNYCSKNLNNLLVGWKFGAQSLGYYKKAYDLCSLPVSLFATMTDVAITTLSKLRTNPDKFKKHYLDALSMISLIGMCISVVLTLTGKDLILLILGARWHESAKIFMFFGPGIGIALAYSTHGWLHLSLGRADRWMLWGIFEFFLTAVFLVIGLQFGASGVAAAWTLSFYVLSIPGLWYAGKPIKLNLMDVFSALWRQFLSAVAAGLISWYLIYAVPSSALLFASANILVRILLSTATIIILYITFITIFYKTFKPIYNIFALSKEMVSPLFR